ncbi:MAG: uroporphyrinogen-III C-methyltransferase [Candidatus Omnitrophota bacterium]|nr:uroporphyrinogen-III C-methyltransferase [Candidatus Omnitrophota bacterium]
MKAVKKRREKGKVFFVGAGPGDPGLLTLRGAEVLRDADVVAYDRLVNPEILNFAPAAEKIYVGKKSASRPDRTKRHTVSDQQKINHLLARLAKPGKVVVRLKGGDPFIFGRGGEEAHYLKKKGVPYEVVPGISAGYAVPAYAGIPVTDRRLSSSVTFVTSHEGADKKARAVDWKKLAALDGTVVCFMGINTFPAVIKAFIAAGKPGSTPVAIIENGTLPGQRVVEGTLRTIAAKMRAAKITSPALTVIGDVIRYRKELAWFDDKPLSGKTVLLTRPRSQMSLLRGALEKEGARVLEFPAIEILPPVNWEGLDRAIANLSEFDWIVFTSANAVRHFFTRLFDTGYDIRHLARNKIAVVGSATQEILLKVGLRADVMPSKFTSEALVDLLKQLDAVRGSRFLLPRTDIAPEYLRRELKNAGAEVTQVIAYRTVRVAGGGQKLKNWLRRGKIDYITFTSSSTVDNFFDALPKGRRPRVKSRLVSIGPVTSHTLKAYGYRPYREAGEHTVRGLVQTLISGGKKS